MDMRTRCLLCGLLIAVVVPLSACSPEAGRVRSGGPGADIGNRSAAVDMHGGSNPGYQVPERGKAIQVERSAQK
jgi:hypothetical protein